MHKRCLLSCYHALGSYCSKWAQDSTFWPKHQPLLSLQMMLDLGLLSLGAGVAGGGKSLGETLGVQTRILSDEQVWLKEGGRASGGQAGSQIQVSLWEYRLVCGKWLKPQMFPGEVRGRVRGTGCRGHGGSGGGEVGRVMLLWLLPCYS